jgi:hypothetical protein
MSSDPPSGLKQPPFSIQLARRLSALYFIPG